MSCTCIRQIVLLETWKADSSFSELIELYISRCAYECLIYET